MKKLRYFVSFCLCLSFVSLLAQSDKSKVDKVKEIVVEESGIHPLSSDRNDTVIVDLDNNVVVYSYPKETASFWYKIYANKDCEITFEIFPAESNNRYNYFLYKKSGDIDLKDVYEKKIFPVRANLYMDEMEKSGTGLSESAEIDYADTTKEKNTKQFYHTAYHGAITALKGDVLLLNIYHMSGEDCGQQLILKSNNRSQTFQSLYSPCYKSQIASVKTEKVVTVRAPQVEVVKVVLPNENAIASYVVWDSLKRSVIDAEITWTKKRKNSNTTLKGRGDIVLEKNTVYSIHFSALGYKDKTSSIVTTDSIASFKHYVFLTPIKEGEDFTMDKIYFFPNTYAMRAEASSELNKLLKYLKENPTVRIEIQGFTNGNNRIKASPDDFTEGSFTGTSKKLSQLRALKIKSFLMENGVEEDRLVANGFGGSRMIYSNPQNQLEANKNIRVGILVLTPKENVNQVVKR